MIYSVSEVNSLAAQVFLQNPLFNNIQVSGEISGGKLYPSGHYYFTIKDQKASLNCVMFRSAVNHLNFRAKDGDAVILKGNVNIYEQTGKFQFIANAMEIQGVGNLHIRFEKYKKELEAKGYFSKENKKPIPKLPKIIGIATSESGSVLQDMLQILRRRFPGFKIHLISVSVQGEKAPSEISAAINKFNLLDQVDVIILARGGGSIEDLWAFNEKIVADAIFASEIPIISAVGHETDFSISDFVADLRAPTPSAAAELVLPEKQILIDKLKDNQTKLSQILNNKITRAKSNWKFYSERPILKQSQNLLVGYHQTFDDYFTRIVRETKHQLNSQIQENNNLRHKLNYFMNNMLRLKSRELENQKKQLTALDPYAVLKRGYTYIEDENKKIISSIKNLANNDLVHIHWHDGKTKARILNAEKETRGET